MDTIIWMDGAILLWIQGHLRNDFLTSVFQTITRLGDGGFIWILITAILLMIPKCRKVGIMSATALLLSLIINNLWLKNWVARIRPYEAIEGLRILTKRPWDYSFPSGHTASSICAAVVFWRCSREYKKSGDQRFYFPSSLAWILFVLAILISFSRLYVGVHYPTDVLGGMITGALIGWFSVSFCKKIIDKRSERAK